VIADYRKDGVLERDIVLISKSFPPLMLVVKIQEVLEDETGVSKGI